MIDPTAGTGPEYAARQMAKSNFVMRRGGDDDRMAGSVPVWEGRRSQQEKISEALTVAADPESAQAAQGANFETAMAYADTATRPPEEDEPFGFGDLLDMVNPLQHIPVVSYVYRGVTGDDIRPASRIIGGALYGGVAGAAGSLVNTIIEYETGRDITGNVVAFVAGGEKPGYRSHASQTDGPEERLTQALELASAGEKQPEELSPHLMGFADMGYGRREIYEKTAAADGRTAGTMVRRHSEVAPPAHMPQAREPITRVTFSGND